MTPKFCIQGKEEGIFLQRAVLLLKNGINCFKALLIIVKKILWVEATNGRYTYLLQDPQNQLYILWRLEGNYFIGLL